MAKKKAARGSGNCSRASVHDTRDTAIITHGRFDVALAAFGALLWVGVPFVLALLKQLGAW